MKKIIYIITIMIAVGFVSCEDESVYSLEENFVLQAYLYANEPVTQIKVNKTVALTEPDSVGEPINDATITLFKNDVAYSLVSSGGNGTYLYAGEDLQVETGDDFYIEAQVGERSTNATTTVPEPPQGTVLSKDVLELSEITINEQTGFPDLSSRDEIRELLTGAQLDVFWDNPSNELHFVVVENAEENQESIFPDFNGGFAIPGSTGDFRQVNPPTRESSFKVSLSELKYWGKYVVKVYRVNQEYADLYENLKQDSRDLNEPPSNINNGLGIFSAFNSELVYFEVVKK